MASTPAATTIPAIRTRRTPPVMLTIDIGNSFLSTVYVNYLYGTDAFRARPQAAAIRPHPCARGGHASTVSIVLRERELRCLDAAPRAPQRKQNPASAAADAGLKLRGGGRRSAAATGRERL